MSEKREPRQSRARTHFKLFSEQLLFGSTRSELLPDERGVWIDFLCLASLNYGEVECFSRDQLSSQLLIDRELLDRSIEKFIKNKKIRRNYKKREKKEIFPIVKWDPYQADYLKKPLRKSSAYRDKKRVVKAEESDTDKSPILEERKGDKTTQKERRGKERKGEEITSKEKREGDLEESNLCDVEFSPSPSSDQTSTSNTEEFSEGVRNSSTLREEGIPVDIKSRFFAMLKGCRGYPFDKSLDYHLLGYAMDYCPDIDILTQTEKKIAWWKAHPNALAEDRGKPPREQLEEWFIKEQRFQENKKDSVTW